MGEPEQSLLHVLVFGQSKVFQQAVAAFAQKLDVTAKFVQKPIDLSKALREKSEDCVGIICELDETVNAAFMEPLKEFVGSVPLVIVDEQPPQDFIFSQLLPFKNRKDTLEEKQMLEATFLQEAAEIMAKLEPLLLHLEAQPQDLSNIHSIFRLVHTVKGSSGVLEMPEFTSFVHTFEDVLDKLKSGQVAADHDVVSVLLKAYDAMGQGLDAVQMRDVTQLNFSELKVTLTAIAKGEVKAKASDVVEKKDFTETRAADTPNKKEALSVPLDLLDDFMAASGEVTVVRNMVHKLVKTIERKLPRDTDVAFLSELMEEMNKINQGMQTKITDLRKIPVLDVVKKLPRTVRDTARNLQKEVDMEIEGGDLRVDTRIGQTLSMALIHMVRNSIDHGIETPEKRVAQGKSPKGKITLRFSEENGQIHIGVQDDGAGIDVNRIRQKIVEKDLVKEEEAVLLSESDVLNYIFAPGFSTAASVTDISGRGVGMDMVMTAVTGSSGHILIKTKVGEGTHFQIVLPVTKSVTIVSSVIVQVGAHSLALPQHAITRLLRLDDPVVQASLGTMERCRVFINDGKPIPIVNCRDILNGHGKNDKSQWTDKFDSNSAIVLIADKTRQLGLVVDTIKDAEDIVVKPLIPCLQKLGIFSGASFMGDGSIGMILDTEAVLKKVWSKPPMAHLPKVKENKAKSTGKMIDYLQLGFGDRRLFALPLHKVHRLEIVEQETVFRSAERRVLNYRGSIIELVRTDFYKPNATNSNEQLKLIVTSYYQKLFGIEIDQFLDIVAAPEALLPLSTVQSGVLGALLINGQPVTILDVDAIIKLFTGELIRSAA